MHTNTSTPMLLPSNACSNKIRYDNSIKSRNHSGHKLGDFASEKVEQRRYCIVMNVEMDILLMSQC